MKGGGLDLLAPRLPLALTKAEPSEGLGVGCGAESGGKGAEDLGLTLNLTEG